ncbi:general transcription factor II-I repeat domain-containing protein 2-like [Oratosquilla oratoria]|uniref:general transcription factor II-I repeat domain-containing protein 2-like n=1 Tax=Oratosquilla oratoria TaxID=337810 RepID=UPI003F76487A
MKGTTTEIIYILNLVDALDKIGVDWMKTVSLATDVAPQVIGRKVGVSSDNQINNVNFIIHREVICSKPLKMDHVMGAVIKAVNFIRGRSLNHSQFNTLLEELYIHGRTLPYHTEESC